jgi:undecaprenyl pyrophosphate phosphatase UppP
MKYFKFGALLSILANNVLASGLFGSAFTPTVINSGKSPSSGLTSILSDLLQQKGWVWYLAVAFILTVVIGLFFNHSESVLKISAKIIVTLVIASLIFAIAVGIK